jgi:hypothetical protein
MGKLSIILMRIRINPGKGDKDRYVLFPSYFWGEFQWHEVMLRIFSTRMVPTHEEIIA